MEQLINKNYLNILRLFYNNKNTPLHLREIARQIKLNESSISRHLNLLEKRQFLISSQEGNLKKFIIPTSKVSHVFPFFDNEKLEKLPLLRKNAIKYYFESLGEKPLMSIVFGSTSKGTYKKESDIDLLEIVSSKRNNAEIIREVEAKTGLHIQIFQMTERDFEEELLKKEDKVIQAAIKTGFPVFNKEYFWKVIYHE